MFLAGNHASSAAVQAAQPHKVQTINFLTLMAEHTSQESFYSEYISQLSPCEQPPPKVAVKLLLQSLRKCTAPLVVVAGFPTTAQEL